MAKRTDFAWLIELTDTRECVKWYAPRKDTPMQFNNDHSQAVRYARKEDADKIIEYHGMAPFAHATQHAWTTEYDEPPADD